MAHTETQYYKLFKEFNDLVMSDDFLTGSIFGISNSVNLSTIFPNILLRWGGNEPEGNLMFYRQSTINARSRYLSLTKEEVKLLDPEGLFGLSLMIYSELHLDIPMVDTMKALNVPKWNYQGFLPLSSCSLLPTYVAKLNKSLYEKTKLPDDEIINIIVTLKELSVDDFFIRAYSDFIDISDFLANLKKIVLSTNDNFKWSSVIVAKTILKIPYTYDELLKLLLIPLTKYKKSLMSVSPEFDIIFDSKEVQFFFNYLEMTPEGQFILTLSQEEAIDKILSDLDIDEVSQLLFLDDDDKQKIKASDALIFDVLMNCSIVRYIYLNNSLNKISSESSDDFPDDFKL